MFVSSLLPNQASVRGSGGASVLYANFIWLPGFLVRRPPPRRVLVKRGVAVALAFLGGKGEREGCLLIDGEGRGGGAILGSGVLHCGRRSLVSGPWSY